MPNTIKTRSGKTLTLNTRAEDAAINRQISTDPDTYEVSAEGFQRMRPFKEIVAEHRAKRMGRPPKANPKEQVSVRYDSDIVAAFRATGDGWQTRMNDALRTFLSEHPLAEHNG